MVVARARMFRREKKVRKSSGAQTKKKMNLRFFFLPKGNMIIYWRTTMFASHRARSIPSDTQTDSSSSTTAEEENMFRL